MQTSKHHRSIDTHVDEALAESFPASDPPGWTLGPPEWADVDRHASEHTADALARLRRQHGNVERLLLVLESELARVHSGEDVDDALLRDVLSYLTEYVNRFHHVREDLAIETIAERVPIVGILLPVVAFQHAEISKAGAALHASLERGSLDEGIAREDFVRGGFAYTRALRTNLVLEEITLFPLATLALTADEWRAIDAKVGADDAASRDSTNQRYRRLFEELTARIGCGCAFE